jgi:hypothetical protein
VLLPRLLLSAKAKPLTVLGRTARARRLEQPWASRAAAFRPVASPRGASRQARSRASSACLRWRRSRSCTR